MTLHDWAILSLGTLLGVALALALLTLVAAWDDYTERRLTQATRQAHDRAPEYEAAPESRRPIPGPIVQRWSPQIEAQCKPWGETDDAALAELLRGVERPYDWKEGGL